MDSMHSILLAREVGFLARHGYFEKDVYDGRHQNKAGRKFSAKKAGNHLVLAGVIGRGLAAYCGTV
jgi:hypothetical protein